MVTYDDVKNKLVTLRQSVLKELLVNKIVRAKNVYSQVYDKISTIQSLLGNPVFYMREGVNMWIPDAKRLYDASQIGFKNIPLEYNDDTVTLDSEEVIPFSVFTFDGSAYEEALKKQAQEYSRRYLVVRIDISATPPEGDFEDVKYVYYLPNSFSQSAGILFDIETNFGTLGDLPRMYEYGLYEDFATEYKAKSVTGIMDNFSFDIAGELILISVFSGGNLCIYPDGDETKKKNAAYKWFIYVQNGTSYDIEVCFTNKTLHCSANRRVAYIYLADIHLYNIPYKVAEGG